MLLLFKLVSLFSLSSYMNNKFILKGFFWFLKGIFAEIIETLPYPPLDLLLDYITSGTDLDL